MEVVPEVVAPLLQLEGVVGPAGRAPSIQVAIPEDTDTYGTALHTAYHCSSDTMAQDPLPESSQKLDPHRPTSNARSSKAPPAAATRSPMRNTGQRGLENGS